jgi:nucleotide-binding universal stress UspA family protein
MKNILLPTDFSENAQAAARYAAQLARQSGARLIILHAYNPLASLASLDGVDKPEETVQAQLDAKAHELHDAYGVSITRLLKPGFAPDEVLALARRVKADLIVLGAQGLSHQHDTLMGRVAIELVGNEEFPVICIPCQEHGAELLDGHAVENGMISNAKGQTLLKKLQVSFEL